MESKSKYCSKCESILPIDSFYLRSNGERVSQCKICRIKINKEFKERNPEKFKNIKKKSRLKYLEKNLEYSRNYYKLHKKERNFKLKLKKRNDPYFKLVYNLRKVLADRLRREKIRKEVSSLKLLGCSIEEFKLYIETKFKNRMNWNNWGRGKGHWHLDHIKPISSFNLRLLEEQIKCFHFSNYQPLWQDENIRKSNKILE